MNIKCIILIVLIGFSTNSNGAPTVGAFGGIRYYNNGTDIGAFNSTYIITSDSFSILVSENIPTAFEYSLSAPKVLTGSPCSLFISVNIGYDGVNVTGDTSCSIVLSGADTIIFPSVTKNYTVTINGNFNLVYYFDMHDSDFSLCIIPDVQTVTDSTELLIYFDSTCNWIKNNASKYAIKAVLMTGDLVEQPTTLNCTNAVPGVDTLKSIGIPILFVPGNHDYNSEDIYLDSISKYHFSQSWYNSEPWFNGRFQDVVVHPYVNNYFMSISNYGSNYLFLCGEYYASYSEVKWLRSIADSLSTYYGIFLTHSFLNGSGTHTGLEYMWDTLEQCRNLKLITNGHYTAVFDTFGISSRGQVVNELLQNYQNDIDGGRGTIRMYIFKPTRNKIDVFTYTPYRDSLTRNSANEFTMSYLTPVIDSAKALYRRDVKWNVGRVIDTMILYSINGSFGTVGDSSVLQAGTVITVRWSYFQWTPDSIRFIIPVGTNSKYFKMRVRTKDEIWSYIPPTYTLYVKTPYRP